MTQNKAAELLEECQKNPKQFLNLQWPDEKVFPWQERILESVLKNKRSYIRACNSSSKTHTVARIASWWLNCFIPSIVVSTATTYTQIESVLWGQIRGAVNKSRFQLLGKVLPSSPNWKIGDNHYGVGLSVKEKERIQGHHTPSGYVLVIIDEGCHDDKTEVLTERRGWQLFKDLVKQDRVMTVNPETGIGEYQTPTEHYEYPHDGDMIKPKGNKGGNFRITKTHKLYVQSTKGQYKKILAGNLNGTDYYTPRTLNWVGDGEMNEDWIRLYAWFISEGSFRKNNKRCGKSGGITISQKKGDNQKEIVAILTRLGFNPKVYASSPNDVIVYDTALSQQLLECGDGFKNKVIPLKIKNLPPKLLNIFLDTFVKGDGYTNRGLDIIYTSSPKLAGDIQEVILKTGRNSVVRERKIKGQKKWIEDHWATSSCNGFVISRTNTNTRMKLNAKRVTTEYYKGNVYCVSVPNGLLLTRRDGFALVSGNSGVPDDIYEAVEGLLTGDNTRLIVIGNPLRPSGKFYQAFKTGTEGRIHIDGEEVVKYSQGCPGLISQSFLDEQKKAYDDGNNPFYLPRCRGEFPDTSIDTVLNLKDIETAVFNPVITSDVFPYFAIDWAAGGDCETVIQHWRGGKQLEMFTFSQKEPEDTIGRLIAWIRAREGKVIFHDHCGLGIVCGNLLKNSLGNEYYVSDIDSNGEGDDVYINTRAKMWFNARSLLHTGGVALLNDSLQQEQLLTVTYFYNRRGKIQIASKQDIKRDYSINLDRADCTIYGLEGFRRIKAGLVESLGYKKARVPWMFQPEEKKDNKDSVLGIRQH